MLPIHFVFDSLRFHAVALDCNPPESSPKSIRVHNGPEFISTVMQEWYIDQSIKLLFIQSGKPM
jgi:hypothetical protein